MSSSQTITFYVYASQNLVGPQVPPTTEKLQTTSDPRPSKSMNCPSSITILAWTHHWVKLLVLSPSYESHTPTLIMGKFHPGGCVTRQLAIRSRVPSRLRNGTTRSEFIYCCSDDFCRNVLYFLPPTVIQHDVFYQCLHVCLYN